MKKQCVLKLSKNLSLVRSKDKITEFDPGVGPTPVISALSREEQEDSKSRPHSLNSVARPPSHKTQQNRGITKTHKNIRQENVIQTSHTWAGEMAPWMKVLAAKPRDLSSIPRAHARWRELLRVVL